MAYSDFLTRTESGETIQIPVDELLRILLCGSLPDGTKLEGLNAIDTAHHKAHEGDHYFIHGYTTLDTDDTVEFVVTTPDSSTHAHMLFDLQSEKTLTVEFYEGTSGVEGGTTATPQNNNRNSSNTSMLSIKKDPTSIGDDGSLIGSYKWGSRKLGGDVSRDQEIILKADETYLWRFTSGEDSNNVWWRGSWYEFAE